MNIAERVAYLKGLAEGMQLSTTTNEGKVLHGVLEVLDEVSRAIDVLEFDIDILDSQVNDLNEYSEECGCHGYGEYDGEVYEVVCPSCKEEIMLDEEDLDEGETVCYVCGEKLEFDFTDAPADSKE